MKTEFIYKQLQSNSAFERYTYTSLIELNKITTIINELNYNKKKRKRISNASLCLKEIEKKIFHAE